MHKLEVLNKPVLISACRNEINTNSESRYLHRLHCVTLVAQGCSCYKVAEWFGEHPSSLERWVHNFNQFGIEGLKNEQKTGRPRKLYDKQLKQLQNDILKTPFELGYEQSKWNGRLLQTHIQFQYDVELSLRQCQRLLSELQHSEASISQSTLAH